MKGKFLILVLSVIGAVSASASTTFTFNSPFVGGVSSNLSDASGTVGVNGLFYGVLVDTNGGSFASSTYDAVTLSLGGVYSLKTSGVATDAVLVLASDKTSNTSAFLEGGLIVSGGNGGVTSVTINYTNGIAAGQTFSLIWFDSSNNTAGLLSSSQFILPTDSGSFVTADSVFVGVDPVRSATGVIFVPVPEPSVGVLGALGGLVLFRRRRN